MIELMVWMLIVSPQSSDGGVPRTLGTFKTQEQCMRVASNMDEGKRRYYRSRCVQANILVMK